MTVRLAPVGVRLASTSVNEAGLKRCEAKKMLNHRILVAKILKIVFFTQWLGIPKNVNLRFVPKVWAIFFLITLSCNLRFPVWSL